jgi:O-acetylhomoserine (thiol)-lyase
VHATGDADADFARIEDLIARLQVIRLVANIGDARSLIAHPASMTHSHLTADQLAEAGITPTTIRLSIGLEDPADLVADLERALVPLVASTTDADQSLSSAAWP